MNKKTILVIIFALMIPVASFRAKNFIFETKSGIILEEKVYNFIKKFGFTDEMIYIMSENELQMFLDAKIDTAKIYKKVEYKTESLPQGGNIKKSSSKKIKYRTITGGIFLKNNGKYQGYATEVYDEFPSNKRRRLEFLMLTNSSGNIISNGLTASGYYVKGGETLVFDEGNTTQTTLKDGTYTNISHKIFPNILDGAGFGSGISIMLPKDNGSKKVTAATIAVAQEYEGIPSDTYVVDFDQYFIDKNNNGLDDGSPVINKLSNLVIDIKSPTNLIFNDSKTNTNYMKKTTLKISAE